MDKLIIKGGHPLKGSIRVSGAKNVAMKTIAASLLTRDTVTVKNIPLISSVIGTANIVKPLNVKVKFNTDHSVAVDASEMNNHLIPLELAGLYRTATMVIGPLLATFGRATVPNPGGCRLGKRPIERHVEGLKALGAKIVYKNGYFYASAKKLTGTTYKFPKNTHTGTETMILASVKAQGRTVLENAACEPEVDDLVHMLNLMGARIERVEPRTLVIDGVKNLSGITYEIMPDRNEVITFAIAAYVTGGDITVENAQVDKIRIFLDKLSEAKANFEINNKGVRFYNHNSYGPTHVTTAPHPGFMTDWQAPWAVFASFARGISTWGHAASAAGANRATAG